jgi:hypothetical protein
MLKHILIPFLLTAMVQPQIAAAQTVKNEIAVFAALDKVTAQISPMEVPIGKTVKFGALTITPRVCNTRPPMEEPLTSAFVEVEETQLDNTHKRIFSGWMFAESPVLHGVEHPVFDVWLTSCKTVEPRASSGNSWKPQ